jgi:hypothetical protein
MPLTGGDEIAKCWSVSGRGQAYAVQKEGTVRSYGPAHLIFSGGEKPGVANKRAMGTGCPPGAAKSAVMAAGAGMLRPRNTELQWRPKRYRDGREA